MSEQVVFAHLSASELEAFELCRSMESLTISKLTRKAIRAYLIAEGWLAKDAVEVRPKKPARI